jgi:hypothetical protein
VEQAHKAAGKGLLSERMHILLCCASAAKRHVQAAEAVPRTKPHLMPSATQPQTAAQQAPGEESPQTAGATAHLPPKIIDDGGASALDAMLAGRQGVHLGGVIDWGDGQLEDLLPM